MMELIVCEITDNNCTVCCCSTCPGKAALTAKLQEMKHLVDHTEIEVKQWESTDRMALDTLKLPSDKFTNLAAMKLDKLSAYSFIFKSQAQYLKQRKDLTDFTTAIMLGDFSKNYLFIYSSR